MLTVTVCIGSSCYVRGSEQMADTFEQLIRERNLSARVELTGAFCMDQCSMGASVRVGERVYRGVDPRQCRQFFEDEIMPALAQGAQP
jgi:NADH:ubiquinone oxidoreductase subunit E